MLIERFEALLQEHAPESLDKFEPPAEPLAIADPPYSPFVLADSPRDGLWAAAGYGGPVTIHDRDGNKLYLDTPHGVCRVHALAFDDSGERLFSGGDDGQIATRRLK